MREKYPFAKLALISYVARMLSIKQDQIKDFKAAFLPIVIPVGIICALILPANFLLERGGWEGTGKNVSGWWFKKSILFFASHSCRYFPVIFL